MGQEKCIVAVQEVSYQIQDRNVKNRLILMTYQYFEVTISISLPNRGTFKFPKSRLPRFDDESLYSLKLNASLEALKSFSYKERVEFPQRICLNKGDPLQTPVYHRSVLYGRGFKSHISNVCIYLQPIQAGLLYLIQPPLFCYLFIYHFIASGHISVYRLILFKQNLTLVVFCVGDRFFRLCLKVKMRSKKSIKSRKCVQGFVSIC